MIAGRGGVLTVLSAGATWIDMASSSPEVGRVLFHAGMPAASGCSRLRPAAGYRGPGPASCGYSWAAMLPWLNITARCPRYWPTRSASRTSAATAPGT